MVTAPAANANADADPRLVAAERLLGYLSGLRNYGSRFRGAEATVVYGDKAIGTNHVLPPMGTARYTGGL